MIHALIVTKAPGALDLLLQQGANPNIMSISQVDDEKVSRARGTRVARDTHIFNTQTT